jgi:hypothetical protein
MVPAHLRANFAVLISACDEVENIPAPFEELRKTFILFGFMAELIATLRSEVEDLRRRGR